MQDYFATPGGRVGHRPRLASAGAVLLLLLQGCAGMRGDTTPATPTVCENAAAQFAVGRSFDANLDRELRARTGARVVRVVNSGQAVTLEYNAQRVSLTLDGRGQVVRAACG